MMGGGDGGHSEDLLAFVCVFHFILFSARPTFCTRTHNPCSFLPTLSLRNLCLEISSRFIS